ncbi:putative ubiquitin-conjugating enzyme E2 25 [Bidens hawaiensis]|uniref:putative ubiquitin-conjugating enzyme E2 25 n=1 Tax=Bidens hawaiensis TaxID=980011 RepID=UPI00404AB640
MKPYYIQMLEKCKNSLKTPFSMADVTVFDAYSRPVAELPDSQSIMKRFEKFKKFEKVSDFSDHFYSNVSLNEQPSQVWEARIEKDLKDLDERMPENVYVRVYEGRTDLLRAVIIGPAATPYHDGLFFFTCSSRATTLTSCLWCTITLMGFL